MVILRILWAVLWFYSALEAKPVMELDPPSGIIQTSTPFDVDVRILHDSKETVDESSFHLGGVKITTEKIAEEVKKEGTESVYRIHFPGYPEGVQLLPELKVQVGGSPVTAIPMTVQVGTGGPPTAQSAQPFLRLSIVFTGKDPLFPGQRAWIGYRIQFNRSIDLLEEHLPLLSPEGFKKLGEVQIRDKEKDGVTTREILQKIEAVTPGEYSFEASHIKGLVYEEESGGTKKYLKPALESQVSAVQLTVASFPKKGVPASFNGAVGVYAIKAVLAGPTAVSVNDPLKVKVMISGESDLETLSLPDLCCQPGFSGQFRLSDLPPVVTVDQKTKTFAFDLFPQSGFLQQLPSIYFSFLDPKTLLYHTVKTDPIVIEVKEEWPELPKSEVKAAPGTDKKRGDIPVQLSRITLPSLFLSWWDGWHLMVFVPLSLGVFWLVMFPPVRKRRASAEALKLRAEALMNSERFFPLILKALQKAVEEGLVEDSPASRQLAEDLEKRIYSSEKHLTQNEAKQQVEALWGKQ